jgi:hypothetical protein
MLTLAGIAMAGLGGCISDGDPGGDDRDGSTPDGSTDSDVTVEDIVAEKAVTYESTMGSGGVLADEDRQYVVATVRGLEADAEGTFTFETADDSWDPGLPSTAGAMNRSVAGHEGGAVDSRFGDGASFLAFAVPSPLAASEPNIRFEGETTEVWPLSEEATARLAAPAPAFELESLTVPDSVEEGHDLSVSLTVRNRTDTDGRFLAAAYWPTDQVEDDDESHIVDRQVPAGETTTAALSIDTRYTASDDGAVTLSLEGHVEVERAVAVTGTDDSV